MIRALILALLMAGTAFGQQYRILEYDNSNNEIFSLDDTGEVKIWVGDLLFVEKSATAWTWEAGYGSLYVKDTAPSTLVFVDDTGAETTLGESADEKVGVDPDATAGYLGIANNDGVLRTGTHISYVDGGDFITLESIPPGVNHSVPFNNNGVWDTEFNITYDDAANLLTVTNLTVGTDATIAQLQVSSSMGIGEGEPVTPLEITNATQPYITLHNSAEEDTDYGRESKLIFRGEQSGGEETVLGELEFSHDGTGDDEQGIFTLRVNDGNDATSPTAAVTVDSAGQVGIGTATPGAKLQVVGSSEAPTDLFQVINNSTATNLATTSFLAPNMGAGDNTGFHFGAEAATYNRGTLRFNYAGDNSVANSIAIDFYAANNMFNITASGDTSINVGGSVPEMKLHVQSADDADGMVIRHKDATLGHYTGTWFSIAGIDADYRKGALLFERTDTGGRGSLHFATENTTGTDNADLTDVRMSITKDGLVGVGSTNPDATLEVNASTGGSLRLTYNDSNGSALNNTHMAVGSDGDLTITTTDDGAGTDGDIVLMPDGNVGIGTTTPQRNLHVYGSTNGDVGIRGENASTGTSARTNFDFVNDRGVTLGKVNFGLGGSNYNIVPEWADSLYFNNTINDGKIVFSIEDAAKMVIGYNGNVGIGTTTPQRDLHVYGSTNGDVGIRGENASTGTSARTNFEIVNDRGVTLGKVNFGLGGSNYNIVSEWADSLYFNNTINDGKIVFSIENAAKMVIGYSGNVGIGTTGPDATLELNDSAGGSLRLTYNDSDGSALNKVDLATDANGGLDITTDDNDGTAGDIDMVIDGVLNITGTASADHTITSGNLHLDGAGSTYLKIDRGNNTASDAYIWYKTAGVDKWLTGIGFNGGGSGSEDYEIVAYDGGAWSTRLSITDAGKVSVTSGDLTVANGAVASAPETVATLGAAATTFVVNSNLCVITGDGGGNTVATITGGVTGQTLVLLFTDANVTITDTAAHTLNTVDLSAAFTSADDTTLTLVFDGTSWYETSRSVN